MKIILISFLFFLVASSNIYALTNCKSSDQVLKILEANKEVFITINIDIDLTDEQTEISRCDNKINNQYQWISFFPVNQDDHHLMIYRKREQFKVKEIKRYKIGMTLDNGIEANYQNAYVFYVESNEKNLSTIEWVSYLEPADASIGRFASCASQKIAVVCP